MQRSRGSEGVPGLLPGNVLLRQVPEGAALSTAAEHCRCVPSDHAHCIKLHIVQVHVSDPCSVQSLVHTFDASFL